MEPGHAGSDQPTTQGVEEPVGGRAELETFRNSPDTEQRRAMLTVSVQEYDIDDVRAVFGEGAG